MFFTFRRCRLLPLLWACCFLLPAAGMGQMPHGLTGSLKVLVQGADGAPLGQLAVAVLTSITGQYHQQATTRGGSAEFTALEGGTYNLEVIASGYDRTIEQLALSGGEEGVVTVTLKPTSDRHAPEARVGPPMLAPKAKMELGRALEAMRTGKLPEARNHLNAAYRLAPGNPEVNYVFGLYYAQAKDLEKARSSWEKVLQLYPKHVGALLSLGFVLLRENKVADASPFLLKAVEAEPASWRAHALLADACMRQGSVDESIAHAERAVELGHGQAAMVQPLLARALVKRGDKDRALHILQAYLQEHPADVGATRLLENLQAPPAAIPASEVPEATLQPVPAIPAALADPALLLPSSWLPPDVDESVPPVEPGVACALDEVMKKAGERVREFVTNVDRFTATESITHETINRWGLASPPEKFKFDYLVSIEEISHGLLNVEEFRPRAYSQARFPDGVERKGLPTLVLIFHPYNAGNFEMNCEGLAHWSGGLAWQVHFRQRTDRPNTIRVYRLGENGTSYPAALKGRAWIAANSYQIVRLETDLVAPLPQIRLVADRATVEYGPVNFQANRVEMWLPQTAEFYYDWRGHRGHRIHRFTNYLLFSVHDRQRMSAPKVEDVPLTCHSGNGAGPDR